VYIRRGRVRGRGCTLSPILSPIVWHPTTVIACARERAHYLLFEHPLSPILSPIVSPRLSPLVSPLRERGETPKSPGREAGGLSPIVSPVRASMRRRVLGTAFSRARHRVCVCVKERERERPFRAPAIVRGRGERSSLSHAQTHTDTLSLSHTHTHTRHRARRPGAREEKILSRGTYPESYFTKYHTVEYDPLIKSQLASRN